jgi:hypothetical protein
MNIQCVSMMIEAIIVKVYLAGAVAAQLLVVNMPKTIALNTIKRATGDDHDADPFCSGTENRHLLHYAYLRCMTVAWLTSARPPESAGQNRPANLILGVPSSNSLDVSWGQSPEQAVEAEI